MILTLEVGANLLRLGEILAGIFAGVYLVTQWWIIASVRGGKR